MLDIYEKLQRHTDSIANALKSVLREARRLRDRLGVAKAEECRYTRFIGIDGSFVIHTGGILTVALVQAAAVVLTTRRDGRLAVERVERLGPYTFTITTPYDSIEARAAIEDAMSVYETLILEKMLEEADSETLIVLDGPIPDPPRHVPLSRLTLQLVGDILKDKDDYHSWRASVVLHAANRGGVAGYVKRPGGIKWLASSIGVALDDQFIAEAVLNPGEYIRPRIAPLAHPLDAYKELYYTYVRVSDATIARIDSIGALGATRAAECLLLLPRAKHPLPVIAAHKAATLRMDDAKRVYRLLLSLLARRLGRDAIRLLAGG